MHVLSLIIFQQSSLNFFINKHKLIYFTKILRNFGKNVNIWNLKIIEWIEKFVYYTSIYDKRDDFNFHITNFPFLSSNIPSSPAYGVFISQLIRYARACSSYECFILRARRLSSKLLKQGYLVERLKSSFRKFYGRYGDLVEQYGVTLSRMLNDILTPDQQWPPYQSDFPPISWPLYRAWPSPNYEWFPWSICNGCG